MDRPVFPISYDPRLPDIGSVQLKHYRTMTLQDPYLAKVFPNPPIIAYKKQKKLREYLARARIPPPNIRPIRFLNGMKRCTKFCHACQFIWETTKVNIRKDTWDIRSSVNCETRNIVYLIQCNLDKCRKRYIGETDRQIKERISEHKGYIKNKILTKPTGEHFNKPGHTIANMKIVILEKVKKVDTLYRREREKYHI